jgi:hypothetical protein
MNPKAIQQTTMNMNILALTWVLGVAFGYSVSFCATFLGFIVPAISV